MRSCGLLAMSLMLAAKEMGYESCPMDGFDYAAVGKLINLPADHVVTMFVVIGKGSQDRPARLSPLSLNSFSDSTMVYQAPDVCAEYSAGARRYK
jgi:nitroreductase